MTNTTRAKPLVATAPLIPQPCACDSLQAAQAALASHYLARLPRLAMQARRMLRNVADAQDACTQVYIDLMPHALTITSAEDMLFQSVRLKCLAMQRDRKRTVPAEAIDVPQAHKRAGKPSAALTLSREAQSLTLWVESQCDTGEVRLIRSYLHWHGVIDEVARERKVSVQAVYALLRRIGARLGRKRDEVRRFLNACKHVEHEYIRYAARAESLYGLVALFCGPVPMPYGEDYVPSTDTGDDMHSAMQPRPGVPVAFAHVGTVDLSTREAQWARNAALYDALACAERSAALWARASR